MNINIRRCMVSDAHKIYELCRDELGYEFPEEQVVANVRRLMGSPENLLLVAETSDEEIVGFVHANNHDPVYSPPMKDIIAIAIEPEYRRQKLGSKLIEAVEQWAKETGAAGVRTTPRAINLSGAAFYRSCGYTYIRTIYNFRKMF